MGVRFPLFLVVLLVALPACGAQSAADFQPAQLRDFQRGEISIERQGGRDTFRVWLARTPAEQQQGLMWIRQLPRDAGMLFLLDPVRPMDMWMKNTYVSLDMIFIRGDGRIAKIAEHTVPLSEARVSSDRPVRAVLEVIAGTTRKMGIVPGDRVSHPIFSRH
jgi:uncharacterized membrane protein (UPF0127 family)